MRKTESEERDVSRSPPMSGDDRRPPTPSEMALRIGLLLSVALILGVTVEFAFSLVAR
jgi:hypothetical protein